MELNSTIFILITEGFVTLLILVLLMFFTGRSRQSKEIAVVNKFVSRVKKIGDLKYQKLESILLDECSIDSEKVSTIIEEVTAIESALLKHIIQMFLQRDPSLLNEIDLLISNLSEPYQKLLAEAHNEIAPNKLSSLPESAVDIKIAGLERINLQLTKQLDTAMQTIDDITGEYTRVFSGNQSALELENSSKKMLQIFHDAEHCIRTNLEE
jgi:flagellin-specific chaperone FliS